MARKRRKKPHDGFGGPGPPASPNNHHPDQSGSVACNPRPGPAPAQAAAAIVDALSQQSAPPPPANSARAPTSPVTPVAADSSNRPCLDEICDQFGALLVAEAGPTAPTGGGTRGPWCVRCGTTDDVTLHLRTPRTARGSFGKPANEFLCLPCGDMRDEAEALGFEDARSSFLFQEALPHDTDADVTLAAAHAAGVERARAHGYQPWVPGKKSRGSRRRQQQDRVEAHIVRWWDPAAAVLELLNTVAVYACSLHIKTPSTDLQADPHGRACRRDLPEDTVLSLCPMATVTQLLLVVRVWSQAVAAHVAGLPRLVRLRFVECVREAQELLEDDYADADGLCDWACLIDELTLPEEEWSELVWGECIFGLFLARFTSTIFSALWSSRPAFAHSWAVLASSFHDSLDVALAGADSPSLPAGCSAAQLHLPPPPTPSQIATATSRFSFSRTSGKSEHAGQGADTRSAGDHEQSTSPSLAQVASSVVRSAPEGVVAQDLEPGCGSGVCVHSLGAPELRGDSDIAPSPPSSHNATATSRFPFSRTSGKSEHVTTCGGGPGAGSEYDSDPDVDDPSYACRYYGLAGGDTVW